MAGPVSLKHSCIMYRNMQAFWHVTLIKINYYYYYYTEDSYNYISVTLTCLSQ